MAFLLITCYFVHLVVCILCYSLVMKRINCLLNQADAYLWDIVLYTKGIGVMILLLNASALLNMSHFLKTFLIINLRLPLKTCPSQSHQRHIPSQPMFLRLIFIP